MQTHRALDRLWKSLVILTGHYRGTTNPRKVYKRPRPFRCRFQCWTLRGDPIKMIEAALLFTHRQSTALHRDRFQREIGHLPKQVRGFWQCMQNKFAHRKFPTPNLTRSEGRSGSTLFLVIAWYNFKLPIILSTTTCGSQFSYAVPWNPFKPSSRT